MCEGIGDILHRIGIGRWGTWGGEEELGEKDPQLGHGRVLARHDGAVDPAAERDDSYFSLR